MVPFVVVVAPDEYEIAFPGELAQALEQGPVRTVKFAEVYTIERVAVQNQAIETLAVQHLVEQCGVGMPAAQMNVRQDDGAHDHF